LFREQVLGKAEELGNYRTGLTTTALLLEPDDVALMNFRKLLPRPLKGG
jgi:hypothetical protein